MNSPKKDPLDQVFMALADGSRREIVRLLAQGEKTVSELSAPFAMSLAAISKHIKMLERAGLVKRRIEGRTHYVQLVPEQLTGALDWISIYRYFWQQRLDQLDKLHIDETDE
ncbi:MAG: metalloregulator ArsR/SmtB family transcription factor [Rhodospirillales bacterium]|nr:metalloregulator ArsR/SmtB family transcription factor [Rhodospirillales bacterium]